MVYVIDLIILRDSVLFIFMNGKQKKKSVYVYNILSIGYLTKGNRNENYPKRH
jgi:hypothetical protein